MKQSKMVKIMILLFIMNAAILNATEIDDTSMGSEHGRVADEYTNHTKCDDENIVETESTETQETMEEKEYHNDETYENEQSKDGNVPHTGSHPIVEQDQSDHVSYTLKEVIPDDLLRMAILNQFKYSDGYDADSEIDSAMIDRLRDLYIDDGEGKEISLKGLGVFKNIRSIDIRNSNLKDLDELENLQLLTYINMESSNLTDEDVQFLYELSVVEQLYLRNNKLTSIGFAANLPYLYSLNFSQNFVSDLTPIIGLKSLDDIGMNNNLITDISPIAHTGGHSNIKEDGIPVGHEYDGFRDLAIWMTGNQITDFSSITRWSKPQEDMECDDCTGMFPPVTGWNEIYADYQEVNRKVTLNTQNKVIPIAVQFFDDIEFEDVKITSTIPVEVDYTNKTLRIKSEKELPKQFTITYNFEDYYLLADYEGLPPDAWLDGWDQHGMGDFWNDGRIFGFSIRVNYENQWESNILVTHVDQDGVEIAEPEVISGIEGTPYQVTPLDLSGFEFVFSSEALTGLFTTEDKVLKLVYKIKEIPDIPTDDGDHNSGEKNEAQIENTKPTEKEIEVPKTSVSTKKRIYLMVFSLSVLYLLLTRVWKLRFKQ